MKNKTTLLIALLIFLLARTNASYAFADRLNDLMNSPEFAEDARLSHIVYEHFLTEQKARIKVDVSSNQHRMEGYNVAENANLWIRHVKPLCNRLTSTYEAAKNANINALKNRADQVTFARAADRFAEQFETSVFQGCREYQKRIDTLNTSDVGFGFHVPRALKSYAEGLANAKSGSSRTLARAIRDQTAGPYGIRVSQTHDLKILLDWIALVGTDKNQLAIWRSNYEKTRKGWEQLITENRDNQDIGYESRILSDAYDGADGDTLRSQIREALSNVYSVNPKEIVLRNTAKRTALERLVYKEGRLEGEIYSAIGFYAVIKHSDSELSTHRGWYELVEGVKQPEAFIYLEDQNFKKPRLDQIVSTLEKHSREEIRNQNSDRIAVQSAKERAEFQKQNDADTDAAVKAAHSEAARLLADAQAKIDAAQKTVTPSIGADSFSLFAFVFSGVLLVGGVLINPSKFIETRFPDSVQKVIDQSQASPRILSSVGMCLGVLGLINILFSVASFSLIGLLSGVTAVLVSCVMSRDQLESKFNALTAPLEKLESSRFALGGIALLLGLAGLAMQF